MLIKTAILAAAAPAQVSQEEAEAMRKYIAVLEQSYPRMQQQRDEARNRYQTCQGRGRT